MRNTQTIEIAPITLLFGPNSVGKSSVLLSLFYLQEVLKNRECSPSRIEALGGKYVGGFERLVNGRDINKKIGIKITLEKERGEGFSYGRIGRLAGDDFGLISDSPTAGASKVSFELKIALRKSDSRVYVSNYSVWLDESKIVELRKDENSKRSVVSYLNYAHPALQSEQDSSDTDEKRFASGLRDFIYEKASLHGNDSADAREGKCLSDEQPLIWFDNDIGALPKLGRLFEADISSDMDMKSARLCEILTDIVVAPLDNALEMLDRSLCIGPLRVIPDNLFQKNPNPKQSDWYSGVAAWDVLGRSISQVEEISYLLTSLNGLNLSYSLRTKSISSEIVYQGGGDAIGELMLLRKIHGENIKFTYSREDINENPDTEQVELDNSTLDKILEDISANSILKSSKEFEFKVVLWDEVNDLEVTSSDIGVGVSQLFPLVVASVEGRGSIISCEQPELHVHPRVQVGLGDMLTQNFKENVFLVETHSEHLILRILRRIRETAEDTLPEGMSAVLPSHVSVIYMTPSSSGVTARRIGIDDEGEFTSRWPEGFFSERAEELF